MIFSRMHNKSLQTDSPENHMTYRRPMFPNPLPCCSNSMWAAAETGVSLPKELIPNEQNASKREQIEIK